LHIKGSKSEIWFCVVTLSPALT